LLRVIPRQIADTKISLRLKGQSKPVRNIKLKNLAVLTNLKFSARFYSNNFLHAGAQSGHETALPLFAAGLSRRDGAHAKTATV
jgi:hypothetical protein